MLIVGEHLTKPVRDEVQVASGYRKPMLVFCKDVPTRHLETQELMRTLDVKYDPFTNVVDLQEKVRMSHGYYLLGLIRGDAASTGKLGDCLARLRGFARQRKVVSIFPTVPVCQYKSFNCRRCQHHACPIPKEWNSECNGSSRANRGGPGDRSL
jgi:hypothetical protein